LSDLIRLTGLVRVSSCFHFGKRVSKQRSFLSFHGTGVPGESPAVALVEIRRMAILAECDICGNQHRVKDNLTGQTLRCKECGVQFVIAAGPSISPETYLEVDGRLRRREPEKAESLWPQLVAWLLAIVIIGVLSGVIWVLLMLVRPASKAQRAAEQVNASVGCGSRLPMHSASSAREQQD
jgi:hypothetical protein